MNRGRTEHFIGIDLGTSGCRMIAIDAKGTVAAHSSTTIALPDIQNGHCEQDPALWWQAVTACFDQLLIQIDAKSVRAIAVDGTSSTLLICDEQGQPISSALMYNDARATQQAGIIKACAPNESGAHGASSSLAKLLYLQDTLAPQLSSVPNQRYYPLHQADWISAKLSGEFGHSDENNCLKLGFDSTTHSWPEWLLPLIHPALQLPKVHTPGSKISTLSHSIAQRFGFNEATEIVAGTTDSIAALIASGVSQTADAVTSLGSTLVLKILSDTPIFSAKYGVYSHKLGKHWLVGGASNSGGRVLLNYFTEHEIKTMTPQLNPAKHLALNYYPLISPGERFPDNDPALKPRLTPRPDKDIDFFQAMLEGISEIEKAGYQRLKTLGAPYPSKVVSCGGGAHNKAWSDIRTTLLGVQVGQAAMTEAAYGSARLALAAYHPDTLPLLQH